ncbi:MAG: RusA family crossover junction endodeoxyribonuclease [Planctomycetes bacterium]|nr:RusA family crossover junction endodeoxyribonuclease [Planctomycetota bacterium]
MGTRHPIGTFVEFVVPHPIASKKNRRKWIKRGGKRFLVPSSEATSDAIEVAMRARVAANGVAFHELDALQLSYEHVLATDEVRVTVKKVGELPVRGRRGTKRDVHGMLETIADALQGVLYPNDSAVDRFAGGRVR